jgi:hypothetical protein
LSVPPVSRCPVFLVSSRRDGTKALYLPAVKVNWSAADGALVPLDVVTVTSTVPEGSAGLTAVIEVSELTVKLPAATAPKLTAVAPVKRLPLMATVVPPLVGPDVGETPVTTGAVDGGGGGGLQV